MPTAYQQKKTKKSQASARSKGLTATRNLNERQETAAFVDACRVFGSGQQQVINADHKQKKERRKQKEHSTLLWLECGRTLSAGCFQPGRRRRQCAGEDTISAAAAAAATGGPGATRRRCVAGPHLAIVASSVDPLDPSARDEPHTFSRDVAAADDVPEGDENDGGAGAGVLGVKHAGLA